MNEEILSRLAYRRAGGEFTVQTAGFDGRIRADIAGVVPFFGDESGTGCNPDNGD
jgi:hypothetical protein